MEGFRISIPMLPLDLYLIVRSIKTTYTRILREVSYPFVASVIMGAAVVTARDAMDLGTVVGEFFVLVGIGGLVYVTVVAIMTSYLGLDIRDNLRAITSAAGG